MKRACVCAAVAGSASVAFAGGASLTIIPSSSTIDVSGGAVTVTATVYGDAAFGTHLLGGAFGLEWTAGGVVEHVSWTPADWSAFNTDPGFTGGNSYGQIVFGQLVLPPIFLPGAGSENGGAIGTFAITLGSGSQGFVDFQLVAGDPFTLEGVDEVSGATTQIGNEISLGSMTFFIPTPGSLSLLGFGGLVLARRRRG